MNLSDTGAGNIYLRELSGVLKRAGLDTQSAENGVLPVSLGGEPLCVEQRMAVSVIRWRTSTLQPKMRHVTVSLRFLKPSPNT